MDDLIEREWLMKNPKPFISKEEIAAAPRFPLLRCKECVNARKQDGMLFCGLWQAEVWYQDYCSNAKYSGKTLEFDLEEG